MLISVRPEPVEGQACAFIPDSPEPAEGPEPVFPFALSPSKGGPEPVFPFVLSLSKEGSMNGHNPNLDRQAHHEPHVVSSKHAADPPKAPA